MFFQLNEIPDEGLYFTEIIKTLETADEQIGSYQDVENGSRNNKNRGYGGCASVF